MKSLSELLHRTPWWALILAACATLAGLVFFVVPYHIIQYRDDGRTAEESRAIKREIDNTFAENAINVGRGVLKGMLARTTDPERRAELEQALAGLEEARGELREASAEVLRAKREALEDVRRETANVVAALEAARAAVADAPTPESKKQHEAEVKAAQRALRDAKRAERDAEKALQRAEKGTSIRIGPSIGKPGIDVQIDLDDGLKAPPPPAEGAARDGPAAAPASPATPDLPPLPPEMASKIRRGVTGDIYRIGIGAGLLLILVPLFIVAIVIKFFVDRSRAAQRDAEMKRKEAEYHRMGQQVTEAKLSALQAQVEPHFLYNTLASVQALTEVDPARAGEMTGHLIQYLRNALPKMRESVSTVGQEIELARAYLSILQMRMGPRLAFTIDVPEALSALPFPPLMLPSLVENAIKHGLEPQREGGTIHISATMESDRLRLWVADTGRGFSDTPGAGVGLANIRERLAALYGETARLTLEANTPRGVIATIDVPAQGARAATAAAAGFSATASAAPGIPVPPAAPMPPDAAGPPASSEAPATAFAKAESSSFWPRAWQVTTKVERAWRITLYYTYLLLVGVAAIAAVGLFVAGAAGMVPVELGDESITGPARTLLMLAAAILGFIAVSVVLALVVVVFYILGFFFIAVALFVLLAVVIGLSPIIAPLVLVAWGIWWMTNRRKKPGPPPERIEPTLAK